MWTRCKRLLFILSIITPLLFTGCARSSGQVWDDTKSCSRYVERGLRSLGGKQRSSRQIVRRDDFYPSANTQPSVEVDYAEPLSGYNEELAMAEYRTAPPRYNSSDYKLPSKDAFKNPNERKEWAETFLPLHFPYDSDLIKGEENNAILSKVITFIRKEPSTFLFIEGHCDQRGSEAYNLALGARRANTIRKALIDLGANPDHLFTVSYGKERLLNKANNEAAWAQNRRGEFKIFMNNS